VSIVFWKHRLFSCFSTCRYSAAPHCLRLFLQEVLKQPIAQLLARQSDKVGFSELAKLGGVAPPNPAPEEEASEGVTTTEGGAPKGLSISVEEPAQAEAAGPSVQQRWSAFCAAQVSLLREGPAQEADAQSTTWTACLRSS
jgi:hypothetical protein